MDVEAADEAADAPEAPEVSAQDRAYFAARGPKVWYYPEATGGARPAPRETTFSSLMEAQLGGTPCSQENLVEVDEEEGDDHDGNAETGQYGEYVNVPKNPYTSEQFCPTGKRGGKVRKQEAVNDVDDERHA